MGLELQDGTGRGYQVKVTNGNQLATQSEIHELQHHISKEHSQVYQIVGGSSDLWNGNNTLLHVKNTSTTLTAVVSYMRLQTPGLSGQSYLPDSGTYFQIGKDTTYSSNGSTATPINMNFSSGNIAALTCYQENPTVTGTFAEFDRWYPDNGMIVFNKHGSLILGLDDSLEIRLVTNRPEINTAYCRVTIMMLDPDQ